MILLTARNLSKSFGVQEVLRDVSVTLAQGDRLGLVGVNGCGKTTLLRALAGELPLDGGQVSVLKGTRIGYLAQSCQPFGGRTVLREMEEAFSRLRAIEARMRGIEAEMASPLSAGKADELGTEYARLSERFETEGGYTAPSRIQGVLSGLGFTVRQQSQTVESLSGGELTRLSLARLLLQDPDLMLLDEPTNHLDLEALAWLEEYLKGYRGSVIAVSHDRYFLDRVCTGVAEILFGVSEQYSGNYTSYLRQRAERFDSRARAYRLQQKEISRQQVIIERFRSFNREKSIRAAESREKALARMQVLDKPEENRQVTFSFKAGRRMGFDALKVTALGKAFEGRPVFTNLSLELKSGDRAALIGANGIGKTSFLQCLAGRLEPDEGSFRLGAGAEIGYYDQKLQQLDDGKTLLEEVWGEFPDLRQQEVRGALGLFLFSGDDVLAKVGTLSGGERARIAFVKLMLAHGNFLLLDEPTNHLDADSREVLEQALSEFDGTILAVSHDRYFINRFATKTIVMSGDGLQVHEGNYDDYLKAAAQAALPAPEDDGGKTRTELARERRRAKAAAEKMDALREALGAAEAAVAASEDALAALEARLADPAVFSNPAAAAETARACRALRDRLADDYRAWEEAEERLRKGEES